MNIINRIYKSLNVLENERTAISLLLAHSFFIGVFLSYYVAYANGVFLKVFKPEMLPYTYVLSGIAGFIASSIFSSAQKVMAYSKVVMGTLVSIFIIIVLFVIGIWTVGETKWLVFLIFVGLIPVFGLVAVQYGGMTMKLFDLRQGKRLFGVIASGEVMSSMIWFFTIPIILTVLPSTWYLLILALIGLGLGVFFQWIIVLKFKKQLGTQPVKAATPKVEESQKRKGSIADLLKNRYFSLIFFLMIFSTLARVFIDYSFMGIARETFQSSLTAFFAIFFGLLKAVELITNTFIAGRLLSKYGVKLGLIILPFLVSIFAVIGVASYWIGAASMVFLALAMNKLFDKTVRTSLEVPSFKTLFQPLDSETKFMVQAQVEGNAGQMAVFAAGGLLILFNFIFPNFTIMQSTYFLCGILVAWLFVARNAIREYRNIVIEKLHDYSLETPQAEVQLEGMEQGLQADEATQNRTFEFLKRYNPILLLPYISDAFKNGTEQMKSIAFSIVEQSKLKSFQGDIENNPLGVAENRVNNLNNSFKEIEKLSQKDIVEYINSNENEKHLLAIQAFSQLKDYDIGYLSEKLLQNGELEIVIAILHYIGQQKSADLYQPLIKNLGNGESGRLSYFQLLAAKMDNSEALNLAFNQFEQENYSLADKHLRLIKIIKLLPANGSANAQKVLLSKISYANMEVRRFAIEALYDLDYQVTGEERLLIKQAIQKVTAHCAWLVVTKLDIVREGKSIESIYQAIEAEFDAARAEIFRLLSFIYEKEAIEQIVQNLNSNLQEREVLAIEMADILLDEDIKEVVFPLIDRISDAERSKQLHLDYPQMRCNYTARLKAILNYDFSRISTWTKCVAMRTLHHSTKDIPLEMIAHVYNSDVELRELALICIFEKDEKAYYKYIQYEKPRAQIRVNRIVGLLPNDHQLQIAFDKVAMLKKVKGFQTLSNDLLLKIANLGQLLILPKGETLKPNRKLKNVIYLVLEGSIEVTKDFETIAYQKQELMGLYESIPLRNCDVKGLETSQIIYFDSNAFFELMQIHEQLEWMLYQLFLKTPSEVNPIIEQEKVVMEWTSSNTGI